MKLLLAALLGVLPLAAQPAPIQSFRLENGLRVLLLEDHQHPVFHLQLAAAWARSVEPKSNAILEPLSLRVLDHCTVGHRSREAFNRAVEERGMSLSLSGVPDGPVWNLAAGSAEAESAFALLTDAVCRPFVVGGDLDDQRLRLVQELKDRSPKATARVTFLSQIERPDLTREPLTELALRRVYIEAIQGFIRDTLRPGRAVLVISGDLDLAQARQLAQINFGTWAVGSVATPTQAPTQAATQAPTQSADALPAAPLTAPSDVKETSLALPFRAANTPQRAAQDLLRIWLPRRLGEDRCQIHPGAAGWYALLLTTEGPLDLAKEELRALRESGLTAKDLDQAKALWKANHRALGLRPLELLTATTMDALRDDEALTEKDIQAVELPGFNSVLRTWLNLDLAHELVLGGEPPTQTPAQSPTPNLEAKSR